MANRNPYATPRARVADVEGDEEYGEVKMFSAAGRIGRVRYIAYSMGIFFVFALVLSAIAAASPIAGGLVGIVGYVALIVVSFLLTIQRAHDFDASGWMSLLILVPLVSLIFLFIPGTRGENRFGKRPPPNTTGAIVLACMFPLIVVVGITAAIAIPAYQSYVHRAEQAQSSQGR